jgi:iron complex transport system substrate-binding protein
LNADARRCPADERRSTNDACGSIVTLSTALREGSAAIGAASACIGVLMLFCITSSVAAPISALDDTGRRVELQAPAKRIVALAPFLTELAFSAGAGDRVVGVSAYSDYPSQAKDLPVISSAAGLSIESIAALRPDLALVWKDSIRNEELQRLRGFGIAVFVAQARTLEDVPRLMQAIGSLVGSDGDRAARAYRAKLARLRESHAALAPLPVLFEIWHKPLTTIAGPHWINEALELCGARNVFKDLRGVAPQLSWEEVYARDPAVVVGAASGSNEAEFLANWRTRPTLAAVKAGRLVFIDPDTIQRPTARLADGVAELCAGLARVR